MTYRCHVLARSVSDLIVSVEAVSGRCVTIIQTEEGCAHAGVWFSRWRCLRLCLSDPCPPTASVYPCFWAAPLPIQAFVCLGRTASLAPDEVTWRVVHCLFIASHRPPTLSIQSRIASSSVVARVYGVDGLCMHRSAWRTWVPVDKHADFWGSSRWACLGDGDLILGLVEEVYSLGSVSPG